MVECCGTPAGPDKMLGSDTKMLTADTTPCSHTLTEENSSHFDIAAKIEYIYINHIMMLRFHPENVSPVIIY